MHHVSIASALVLSASAAIVSIGSIAPPPLLASDAARERCIGYLELHVALASSTALADFVRNDPCRRFYGLVSGDDAARP